MTRSRYSTLATVIASIALLAASSAQAQTASDLIAQIARELDRRSVVLTHSNRAGTTQEIRVLGETVTSTISGRGPLKFRETIKFNLSNIGNAVWGLDAEGWAYELRVFCRQSTECISISSTTQNRKVSDWYVFYHFYGQTPTGYHPVIRHSENINEERVASLINQLAVVRNQDAQQQPISTPQDTARPVVAGIERALSLTRAQRAEVQSALNALGHNSGAADGIFGPLTRRAIKVLQERLGLPQTGYLDQNLVNQLMEAADETHAATGSLPSARTCITARTVGTDSSKDDYSVEVEFSNNCAYEVTVRWRYLHGLKYEYERGSPIKCSSGAAHTFEPGESYTARMGPLPRGITQKWRWCVQYAEKDTQQRTGFMNCYESNRPNCPPIPH